MVPTSLTKTNLSQSIPSLNICISAANSITHLTEQLSKSEGLKYAWTFTTYEVLSSSLIHLTNSASVDERLQAQARSNLKKGINYMKLLGTRWFNAAKFASILEDLMCAHLNFDEYKVVAEGRSMEPVIVARTDGPGVPCCPIILRDQNHPSGGTLLFAPKAGFGSPHTTTSTLSTPNSSPMTATVQNPESSDMVPEATGGNDSESSSSFVPTSDHATKTQGTVPVTATATAAATVTSGHPTTRPMKKTRKATSQRNSLLFQAAPGGSPSPPMAGVNGVNSLPDQSVFTFSSLTTPGMFAQGQTFMDYEQMMAQQQLQMAQQQELQQLQSFSATPLFSSSLALQGRTGQIPDQSQNPNQKQDPLQLQQQKQQFSQMQFQSQAFGGSGNQQAGGGFGQQNQQGFDASMGLPPQYPQQQQQPQQQPQQQHASMQTQTSPADLGSMDTSGSVYNFGGGNNMTSGVSRSGASAIPGVMEDYSTLPLFPQQDATATSSGGSIGVQNPNLMAVPNPFFGIPNTIDWDEWNQYIASAGLQKF